MPAAVGRRRQREQARWCNQATLRAAAMAVFMVCVYILTDTALYLLRGSPSHVGAVYAVMFPHSPGCVRARSLVHAAPRDGLAQRLTLRCVFVCVSQAREERAAPPAGASAASRHHVGLPGQLRAGGSARAWRHGIVLARDCPAPLFC